jgi:hypothetical protein
MGTVQSDEKLRHDIQLQRNVDISDTLQMRSIITDSDVCNKTHRYERIRER